VFCAHCSLWIFIAEVPYSSELAYSPDVTALRQPRQIRLTIRTNIVNLGDKMKFQNSLSALM